MSNARGNVDQGLGISKVNINSKLNYVGNNTVEIGGITFPPRKVWVKTYGCQMNYHDSERLLSHLRRLNFSKIDNPERADMVLVNSCAIRDLSNNKFYSQLGELKHLKRENKDLIIGIGGCVAQVEGKGLLKKYPHLDFAFGTDMIDTINDMVFRAYAGERSFVSNSWDRSENFSISTKITHDNPKAFINIIKGCNKYCSYCIVPYTRGKERSRRIVEVVSDIKNLVEYSGIQEVTLLGQNVNSYGHDNNETFSDLLVKLDQINGLELIRYTTSHPYDVSDELIDVHGNTKKLANHLHLPVQSGSDDVLTRMCREYTVEHYLGLLKKLRISNSNIVITTDIIVGFVNETEEEYKMTLKLLKEAQFDSIYAYAYSKRPKTKAAKLVDKLSDDIRGVRLRELQMFQLSIQEKLRSKLVGRRFTILVDGHNSMRGIKKFKGRSSCNRIIHFIPEDNNHDYKWDWVDIEITSTTALSCQGRLIKNHGKKIKANETRY